jgi:hypothetical protein
MVSSKGMKKRRMICCCLNEFSQCWSTGVVTRKDAMKIKKEMKSLEGVK